MELSLSQRIRNAFASQEVENLQATHSYLHAASRAKEEWTTIWSRRDDTSWAHDFGRARGFEQIWYDNVSIYDAQTYQNYIALLPRYRQIGGMDPRPLFVLSFHSLASSIIEVAKDGRTARAAFFTPGTLSCMLTPEGVPYGTNLWERYGSDFIFEDGQWKYFHQQVCPDLMGDFDNVNLSRDSYLICTGQKEPVVYPPDPVEVTDPGPLHLMYSVVRTTQHTVPWPEAYDTMDEFNTYTIPYECQKGEDASLGYCREKPTLR